jgi:hypothetical protein
MLCLFLGKRITTFRKTSSSIVFKESIKLQWVIQQRYFTFGQWVMCWCLMWRIMDKHIKLLAPKYFETKFICVDAEVSSCCCYTIFSTLNPKPTYFGETYISPLFRSSKNVLQLLRHYYVDCSWFCRIVPSLLQSWQSRCCPVSSFSGALQKHKSLVLESCSEFGFNKQA